MKNDNGTEKLYLGQTLLKRYSKLKIKKYRDADGLFIAEGVKICEELIKSDYAIETLIIDDEAVLSERALQVTNKYRDKGVRILFAGKAPFGKISDTKTPQSLIAVAHIKQRKINSEADVFIALENINDPGNLGTILRTARWFGVSDVVLSRNSADIYSPKVIRGSMGNLFEMNIEYCDDTVACCKKYFPAHRFLGTDLRAEKTIYDVDTRCKTGLFFGSEADGLSADVLDNLDETFIIPSVNSQVESLNLSVSAGIVLYHFCGINK